MRLPLLELSLDPYLEGGSKGPTPRGKPSSFKRARSPTPSSSSQGPDVWLSPSKRRVLFEEGLLSPRRALTTTTPRRRLFGHVDHQKDDDESPVGRALFTVRDIELRVTPPFAAAHPNLSARGLHATECGSTPPRTATNTSVKLHSPRTFGLLASWDGATLADTASLSSPATMLSSPSINGTPRAARPYTPQPGRESSVIGLEPSPEIKVTAKIPATHSLGGVSNLVPNLTSAPVIKKTSSTGAKIDIPWTYSSNPAVPLDAPELQFTRPTLQDSMTFVQGSRHYPGFVVRTDTPSPRRESSSSEASSSSSRSTVSQASDAPSDSECSDIDEKDEDKENAAVTFVMAQRLKRKKLAASSREATPVRDVSTPPSEVPRQVQTSERAPKRARTAALLPPCAFIPGSQSVATSAVVTTSDVGRDRVFRREGRFRLLEVDIDDCS